MLNIVDSPISTYSWSKDGLYIIYTQDKSDDEGFHIFAVAPTATTVPGKIAPPSRGLTPLDRVKARIYATPLL